VKAVSSLWSRIPAPLREILIVAVSVIEVENATGLFTDTERYGPKHPAFLYTTAAAIACAGLLLRHRWPLAAVVLTAPSMMMSGVFAPPMFALYSLGRQSRNRKLLLVVGLAAAAMIAIGLPDIDALFHLPQWFATNLLYQAFLAALPILLGQLMQTRADLSERIVEIEAAKRHEQELYAQTMLARARSELAREMHDVVSHQVSLIAVQASALRLTATAPRIRDTAEVIWQLSSATLEELRSMVMLLGAPEDDRADGAPQPTIADLPSLLGHSDVTVSIEGSLPADLSPAVQRAIYRTVQESLTNARKHAPGAPVSVRLWNEGPTYGVQVTSGRSALPALELPGSGLGLAGLRDRAELLGGTLEATPTADGFQVRLALPAR
jgi:signal transduction histidine kinase